MAIPTLPQNDPQPDLRSAGLAADRALVDFNRTQHGIVRPSAVPEADQFSFRWDFEAESLAIGAELEGEFGAWQVAADDTRPLENDGAHWRRGCCTTWSVLSQIKGGRFRSSPYLGRPESP